MTLEQYEALLAEKKAELNKARVVRTIDDSEFKNLKVISKDDEVEENPLEVGVGHTHTHAHRHTQTHTCTPGRLAQDTGGVGGCKCVKSSCE